MAEEKKVPAASPTPAPARTVTARRTSKTKAPAGSALGNTARVAAALLPAAIATVSVLTVPRTTPPTTPSAIVQTAPASGTTSHLVQDGSTPLPLLSPGHPVDWWFVFKLNATAFPKCGTLPNTCPFGGDAQTYRFGQQYAYASSDSPTLASGGQECMGTSTNDPVGATYDEVFNSGKFHYLVWNDQFHDLSPAVQNCSGGDCDAPWGHSKGMVAWNDAGEGFVMQVSTPSWPGTGSSKYKDRAIGNTLGCIKGDDDVEVSQHFFALRLTEPDLMDVLKALRTAGVTTDPSNPQIAQIGGPVEVTDFFKQQTPWAKPKATAPDGTTPPVVATLSTGVKLIAKPSSLNVPPWQMVSSVLGGVNLRAATWWASPPIPSTVAGQVPACWDSSLKSQAPGAVDIALIGTWQGKTYSLKGDDGGNHAKIGVSTSGAQKLVIFGDENQQGKLGPGDCSSSQNGRGGMFFVMEEPTLQQGMTSLISATVAGDTAPTK